MKNLKSISRMSQTRNENGFSLISVVFAMLLLGSMGISMGSMAASSARSTVTSYHAQEAFQVAEGGMNFILSKEFLHDVDTDFTTHATTTSTPFGATFITLGNGKFWVEYLNSTTTTGDVRITAQVGNSVRTISQSVAKGGGTGQGLMSGGDTVMISSQGGGGTITADIECGGACSTDAGYTHTGVSLSGTDELPPPVIIQPFINMATTTINGNYTINGDHTGNLYVTGRLNIGEEGTINGVLVADGDVIINVKQNGTRIINGTIAAGDGMTVNFQQDSVATFTAQAVNGEMQPLLTANGNILIDFFQNDSATLQGLIHAGGTLDIKVRQMGDALIEGALMAGGDLLVDSKQDSNFVIDFPGSGGFLGPGNGITLTNWKEE